MIIGNTPNPEKVIDALHNCIAVPKCRDCPWEECENLNCKRAKVPVSLLADALKLLEERKEVSQR